MWPLRRIVNSCFEAPPEERTKEPSDVPFAVASEPIKPDVGLLESKPTDEAERRRTTPDGAIRTPLTRGTEPFKMPLTLPTPCNPAELRALDPADSDMKHPKK